MSHIIQTHPLYLALSRKLTFVISTCVSLSSVAVGRNTHVLIPKLAFEGSHEVLVREETDEAEIHHGMHGDRCLEARAAMPVRGLCCNTHKTIYC
jgi:hypothetical protein